MRTKQEQLEHLKQYRKDYYKKWKLRVNRNSFKSHLWDRYKLTVDQFTQMVNTQKGLCKICFNIPPNGQRLCVDHCHKTGRIRGLLCRRCNSAIGLLKDDIDNMWNIIEYLKYYDYSNI